MTELGCVWPGFLRTVLCLGSCSSMCSLSIGCDGEEIPGGEVQPIGMRCWQMKGIKDE